MRSHLDEYDLRIGYSFLDSPIFKQVGYRAFLVYLKMRRHVWRSKKKGKLADFFSDGMLVSSINQGELAEQLNISRKSVCEDAETLQGLGWLRKIDFNNYELVYHLGNKVGGVESFFLDVKFQEYAEWLEEFGEAPPSEAEKLGKWAEIFQKDDTAGVCEIDLESSSLCAKVTTHVVDGYSDCNPGLQHLGTEVTPPVTESHNIRKVVQLSVSREVEGTEEQPMRAASQRAVGASDNNSNPPPSPTSGGLENSRIDDAVDGDAAAALAASPAVRLNKPAERRVLGNGQPYAPKAPEGPIEAPRQKRARREGSWTAEHQEAQGAFTAAFAAKYPEMPAPNWGQKERAQLKQLFARYPANVVKGALLYAVSNWGEVESKLGLRPGIPCLGAVAATGIGDTIIALSRGVKFEPRAKPLVKDKTGRFRGEYDEESAKRSPKVGWSKWTKQKKGGD